MDRPDAARSALDRMPATDPARAILLARLAAREGRLSDGMAALRRRARRAGRPGCAPSLAGELYVLTDGIPPDARPAHPIARGPRAASVPGRVLHLVTDALPTTNAGYTVRTQRIAVAQREAGLDPHVVTKAGFPVAQGHLDGRRVATWTACPTTGCCPTGCRPGPTPRPRSARTWPPG